jgi:hypothetical protein
MRRSRLIALLLTVIAVAAGSLAVTSPASADTFGPIQNYGNGLCMQPEGNSPEEGALIVQEPCELFTTGVRNLFQEWYSLCQDSSCRVFYWVNRGSGLCMRARGPGGPFNGAQIMQWECNWITDVDWDYGTSPVVDAFVLESRISGSRGYCLDVPGASGAVGLPLQLYSCNQTGAQIWLAPSPIIE